MISEENIRKNLEPYLNSKQLFIIDIHISPYNQIEIIIDGDNYVSIDTCVEVSRFVENFLNEEKENFSLIVSSPDVNKPLRFFRQYPKHIGKEILIHTNENKEIKGKIISVDVEEMQVLLKTKEKKNKKKIIEQEVKIPYTNIKKAKILLPF